MQINEPKSKEKRPIPESVKWVFGTLFLFCTLFSIPHILQMLGFFLVAAVLFPPIENKWKEIAKGKLTTRAKWVILIGGFVLAGYGVDREKKSQQPETKTESVKKVEKSNDGKYHYDENGNLVSSPDGNTEGKETPPQPSKPDYAYSLTAPQLNRDYQANEVAADERYKGKKIAVTGIVEDIKKDFTDDIYINLSSGEDFQEVHCYFPNKQIAAQLRKGNQITLIGKCDGLMVGSVILKDCEFAQ